MVEEFKGLRCEGCGKEFIGVFYLVRFLIHLAEHGFVGTVSDDLPHQAGIPPRTSRWGEGELVNVQGGRSVEATYIE